MQHSFLIHSNTVHLWRVTLSNLMSQENYFLTLLSQDEVQRAGRFHFAVHRERFIIARGMLRQILALYTKELPQDIIFSYGPHGKPYLSDNLLHLQFNVSHSHDVAMYAMITNNEIGIDIEKIAEEYQDSVAKRILSESEYAAFSLLKETEKTLAFYHFWACKEALMKASGQGLQLSTKKFSVSLDQQKQSVLLTGDEGVQPYYLEMCHAYPGFAAAFATKNPVKEKQYWEWLKTGPAVWLNSGA